MHALGFVHEQQRPDRDLYVIVDKTKMSPRCFHAFELIPMYSNKHKSDSMYHIKSLNCQCL